MRSSSAKTRRHSWPSELCGRCKRRTFAARTYPASRRNQWPSGWPAARRPCGSSVAEAGPGVACRVRRCREAARVTRFPRWGPRWPPRAWPDHAEAAAWKSAITTTGGSFHRLTGDSGSLPPLDSFYLEPAVLAAVISRLSAGQEFAAAVLAELSAAGPPRRSRSGVGRPSRPVAPRRSGGYHFAARRCRTNRLGPAPGVRGRRRPFAADHFGPTHAGAIPHAAVNQRRIPRRPPSRRPHSGGRAGGPSVCRRRGAWTSAGRARHPPIRRGRHSLGGDDPQHAAGLAGWPGNALPAATPR